MRGMKKMIKTAGGIKLPVSVGMGEEDHTGL